jgi:hypothetical protein
VQVQCKCESWRGAGAEHKTADAARGSVGGVGRIGVTYTVGRRWSEQQRRVESGSSEGSPGRDVRGECVAYVGISALFEGKQLGCTEQTASGILLGRQTTRPGSILYLMLCGSLARSPTLAHPDSLRGGSACALASHQLHTTHPPVLIVRPGGPQLTVCLSGGRGRTGDSLHTAHGRAAL